MSRKTRPDLSRLFNRVPSVDSPLDLDQKILAESRRLAPERQGRYLRSWMPVTATVCMIGLAVFVAKPVLFNLKQTQRVQTSPVLQKQEGAPAMDSYKDDQVQEDVDSTGNRTVDTVMENEVSTPETTSKSVPAIEMLESHSNLVDEAAENLPADEIRQEFQVKKSSSENKEVYSAPDYSSEAARSASVTMEQDDVSVGASMSEPMVADSLPLVALVSEEELENALEEIRILIEAGKLKAAGSQLEELRKRCPGCDVPDSLEDF